MRAMVRPAVWLPVLSLALSSAAAGPASASAGPRSLEEMIATFQAMPGLTARFEEERHLSLLSRPLRSRGHLYFVPPDRLVRRVDEPVSSLLQIDSERIAFADDRGSESLDLGANPLARLFAESFTKILAGDLDALRAVYDLEFEPAPEALAEGPALWRLVMVPRAPELAGAIARIELRGSGPGIVGLRVEEAGGDYTATHFDDVDVEHHFGEAELLEILRMPGS